MLLQYECVRDKIDEIIVSSGVAYAYYELINAETNEWAKFHKGISDHTFVGFLLPVARQVLNTR